MAEERVQRRLAAILAADVVGYSRLMEADEVGTRARFNNQLETVVQPTITNHRGRLFKTMGDGFLVEFGSVVDAVQCATDIQNAVASRETGEPDERKMLLRMGIHLGDVIVEGDDIHGDGVNIAARLEGLADSGGICVSDMVRAGVRNKLDIELSDLGEKPLKNIAEPVQVYRLVMKQDEVNSATTGTSAPLPLPDKPSIAVLPFENMSGDPEQEYFADGLTEDLITALSRWRAFPIIARNSTFAYKGTSPDIRKVGEELGARYIVEGSVRKAGGRVRITAQLINAETGHHIWAERFDRELADMFELQDEITQHIAAIVEPELGRLEQQRSASKHPASLDAWDCFQRGMYLLYHFTKPELAAARTMFQRALELDPKYGQAHTGLAYSHQLGILNAFTDDREDSLRLLTKHARQGVALDDNDSFAHVMMLFAHRWAKEHDRAIAEGERAIELNPNDAWALAHLGNVLDLAGRSAEGIAYLERALVLNSRGIHIARYMSILARAYLVGRDYAAAETWARKAIQRFPDEARGARAYLMLASTLGHLDRLNEARDMLDTCCRVHPRFIDDWKNWLEYRNAADNEHILDGLRKAGLPE